MNPIPQIFTHLASATKNPHVSVPLILALACEAGKIWIPAHATQFDATQKLLFSYGVIASANSGPTQNGQQKGLS